MSFNDANIMKMPKIKIFIGDKIDYCNCGSWIQHWTNFAEKPAVFCSEFSCKEMHKLEGARVKKEDDDNWYVIPLCNTHHVEKEAIDVNSFTKFITADETNTCSFPTVHLS